MWRWASLIALVGACASTGDGPRPPSDASPPRDAAAGTADARPDAGSPWTGPGADPRVWRPRVIYLTIPDRFANGDPQNDDAGAADCFDPKSPTLFHGGDLAGLRAHVDYLHELGVGALWMTPLVRQAPRRYDSCGYHGYWADLAEPADPIAQSVEPKLGSAVDLDRLLSDLHDADVRVLLDVVVNHVARNARLAAQEPGWFHDPNGCADLGPADQFCSLNGLPDLAQENPTVAAYITATTTEWLDRYAFDGVRMDTAKHVPLSYFADSWMPAARAATPHPFVVAEVFSDMAMSQFAPYLDAGFDSFFHFPLRRALVDSVGKGGSLNELAGVVQETVDSLGLARALMVTTFLDNHDLPRFMQEAGDLPDAERGRRYRLALVALFTLPGIPQLYYGDELGMLGNYPDNRRDMPAWAFDPATRAGAHDGYLGDPAQTFALTRSLIALRRQHAALHDGYYSELWRPNSGANLYAFYRAAAGDRALVVIDNGTGDSGNIDLHFATNPGITTADRAAWPDGTVLHDVLGLGAPATVTVSGGTIRVAMPSKTAAIYLPVAGAH